MTWITKGTRVQARWLRATDGCVAGMQPKVAAREYVVCGVVTHVRGDHPIAPTTVGVWIRKDDGEEVGPTDSRHVVAAD